ncbi:hypothetical protein EAI_07346 [Harpegnathos saltator]|uniref:Uncharacterized protein n=1 Tax=Harpegnathos saltator TaxID=610380 RepID=E2BID3_HARSA|nr:hypothetical protein EAI_07346 [Harpegnathos saltator]
MKVSPLVIPCASPSTGASARSRPLYVRRWGTYPHPRAVSLKSPLDPRLVLEGKKSSRGENNENNNDNNNNDNDDDDDDGGGGGGPIERVYNYNYRSNLRRNHLRQAIPVTSPGSAESLWPIGVFLPPIDINDLGYSWHEAQRGFSNLYKSQERDPYLLTGREAMMAIKYLYGLGELFFDDYPHVRALLRNQEERRLNGLHGNVLSSLNPQSPFYRKGAGLN